MYTEREANEKRCPALEIIQALHSSSAPGGPNGPVGCIGSNCMFWRWGEKDREKCFHSHGPAPDPEIWERVSPTDAIGVWPTYRRKKPRGYCGLASKP